MRLISLAHREHGFHGFEGADPDVFRHLDGVLHFFEAGRIIIGRSPDSDIYIDSHYVSRHHLQLTSSASGCIIEDLNSTNGVFIGDDEVQKQLLSDGDIISLGTHELVYADLRDADKNNKDDTSVNENQA